MVKKHKHIYHLPKNQLAEIFGWIGSVAILSGYALLSLGIVDGNSLIYHLIFLVGSAGLALVTYRHRAYQSLVVNVTFSVLALIAVMRIALFA